MDKEEMLIGRVSLNGYHVSDKKNIKPTPVIEILAGAETEIEGEIIVFKILRSTHEE